MFPKCKGIIPQVIPVLCTYPSAFLLIALFSLAEVPESPANFDQHVLKAFRCIMYVDATTEQRNRLRLVLFEFSLRDHCFIVYASASSNMSSIPNIYRKRPENTLFTSLLFLLAVYNHRCARITGQSHHFLIEPNFFTLFCAGIIFEHFFL